MEQRVLLRENFPEVGDALDQYDIVKRTGNRADMCVHAGMVAAAFLRYRGEAQYRTWKATEKADCSQ